MAAPIKTAFVKGFGIVEGAIASTVAHDSHNLIVVGSTPQWMAIAAQFLISSRGGIAAIGPGLKSHLALPIAGIMSPEPISTVAEQYAACDVAAKALGSKLTSPFMTLSFMALLVIPELKLSDLGLFDARPFGFVELER
jgi:adenine deaminase